MTGYPEPNYIERIIVQRTISDLLEAGFSR
jgi:hypothetical protein